MKESAAWKLVGEKVEKAMESENPCSAHSTLINGICSAVRDLWFDLHFKGTSFPYEAMTQRVERHVLEYAENVGNMYAYPAGTEWEARILAIYWMMQEAEEEWN